MSLLRIAIDGSAASGKTTVAKSLAEKLGILFLDTGLMYRAVAWQALESGLLDSGNERLTRLAEELPMQIRAEGASMRVLLDGLDVTDELHRSRVSEAVASVAGVSGVRRAMVARQRAEAEGRDVVMVGRDIGSVVLPAAELKVFLSAALEERALRRFKELADESLSLDDVRRELAERDRQDREREDSPLVCPEGAVVLDSTGRSIDEVVQDLMGHVESCRA